VTAHAWQPSVRKGQPILRCTEIVACRGRIVALDEHVSRQGLPWVSGLLESVSGLDRFEVWPVPYRSAGWCVAPGSRSLLGLTCGRNRSCWCRAWRCCRDR